MTPEQEATALAWDTLTKGVNAYRVLAMGRDLHMTLGGLEMLTIWNDTLRRVVLQNEIIINQLKQETSCAH